MSEDKLYTCPSCGFLVFSEPECWEICGMCGWEDDPVQASMPGLKGGANGGSLKQYQDEALKDYPVTIKAADDAIRDPGWRPLKDDECIAEQGKGSGIEYFDEACNVEFEYYWEKI